MSTAEAIYAVVPLLEANSEDGTFTPAEVVAALPHLNKRTVRGPPRWPARHGSTHVTSRCCVNAPANHNHRPPYLKRVGRGRYKRW